MPIDPYHATLELLDGLLLSIGVMCPYTGSQSIIGLIGSLNSIIQRRESTALQGLSTEGGVRCHDA